jgi:hypothetical protein
MKLHNECVVAAPLNTTWAAVVDLARIASALPGAALERTETSGTFRGTMKIKFGPVVSEYAGTATLEEVDEDKHVAIVRIQGREVRGQGSASATIRNSLASVAGGTQLRIDTDLSVSGIAAQLGSGMIEEVSATLLNDFAKRLERELSGAPNAVPETAVALDAGAAAAASLRRRIVPLAAYAAGLAVATAFAYQLGRRSR